MIFLPSSKPIDQINERLKNNVCPYCEQFSENFLWRCSLLPKLERMNRVDDYCETEDFYSCPLRIRI